MSLQHAVSKQVILFKRSHAQHLHLFLGEETPVATTEVLLGEACKLHAVELHYALAEALEDTTHDAVLAAMTFDAHLALIGVAGIFDSVGFDFAVFQLYASGNLLHVVCSNVLVEIYVVYLLLQEFGMGEL